MVYTRNGLIFIEVASIVKQHLALLTVPSPVFAIQWLRLFEGVYVICLLYNLSLDRRCVAK